MSWSGKKYKRVSSENVESLIEAAKISKENAAILKANDAIFSYTRDDGENITFTLESAGRKINGSFKLGEEHEMERRDGTKVKAVHQLESENVLTQIITDAKGHKSFFKREFDGNKCTLTITASGNDIVAKIYYESVERHRKYLVITWFSKVLRIRHSHSHNCKIEKEGQTIPDLQQSN